MFPFNFQPKFMVLTKRRSAITVKVALNFFSKGVRANL